MIGVCSNKPRPSVDTGRLGRPTGESVWGRDPWHFKGGNNKTLCGINCSEWLIIGEIKPDIHLCERCRKKEPTDGK